MQAPALRDGSLPRLGLTRPCRQRSPASLAPGGALVPISPSLQVLARAFCLPAPAWTSHRAAIPCTLPRSSSRTTDVGPFRRALKGTSSSSGGSNRILLQPARATPSSSISKWNPNPMELVRREAGLQSNRLDTALRERVEAAVERLGGRVTVGDVAAKAGVKLADADEALKALAYDTAASLKVSSEGDVVYGFAPDFRSRLRSRSLLITATPLLRRAVGVLSYLTRVVFGTTLIASVALVWLAIAVLLSNRGGDQDDRRRGRGGGGVTFYVDPFDLFWYWNPSGTARRAPDHNMNFLEAVFSFVFGDGDPNKLYQYDEQRWQALGNMIREKNGVVTAEEMAPFLDPPEPAPVPHAGSGEPYVPYPDENFVLPALIKFGGEPEVDDRGRILYRFPALQKTGVKGLRRFRDRDAWSWDVPLEQDWKLTLASPGQVVGVIALGLFNLVGVAVLGGLLADPHGPALLAMNGLGFIAALMGPLSLYATSFFAIPAVRWFLNQFRNREVEQRNEARRAAVEILGTASHAAASSPASAVSDKLAAARMLGEGRLGMELPGPRLVGDNDIIFDSGREVGRQLDAVEVDDWNRRMKQREREHGGGWGRR